MRGQYYILLLLISILYIGCGAKDRSTDTRSKTFTTDEQKIDFLKKYVRLYSSVKATEFHIIFHDNSTGLVPGPSDWDIKVALLIESADIYKWLTEFTELTDEQCEITWVSEILPEEPRWNRASKPQFYKRSGKNVELTVYEKEGILLKRIQSQ